MTTALPSWSSPNADWSYEPTTGKRQRLTPEAQKWLRDLTRRIEEIALQDQVRMVDGINVNRFGRIKTANPLPLFDNAADLSNNPLLWEQSVVGTGAVAHRPEECSVRLTTGGTANLAAAVHQTKARVRYQPGRALSVERTFAMSAPKTNAFVRVGYFDVDNGIFLQRAGSDVSIVRRSNITGTPVDEVIPQASWSNDPMDGTGPSRKTLDLTKTQLMRIEIGFLGVDGFAVWFKVDGQLYLAHESTYSNDLAVAYMSSGCLPIRDEVANGGAASGIVTLDSICSSASSDGVGAEQFQFSASNQVAARNTAGTAIPLISIRAATVLGGVGVGTVENRGLIRPLSFDLLVTSQTHFWRLLLNPTLTNPTWTPVNTASLADVDVSATAASGGYVLDSGYVAASASARGAVREALSKALPLVYSNLTSAQDVLTLEVRTTTGNGTALGALTWIEEY